MKITQINDQNLIYFEGLIGDLWDNRNQESLFVGLIDDENTAVSAAVFSFMGQNVSLNFIATDKRQRRKGYAAYLLKASMELMKTSMVYSLSAVIYVPGEFEISGDVLETDRPQIEGQEAIWGLLDKVGMKFYLTGMNRSVYRLGDIGIESAAEKPRGIKSGEELGEEELKCIREAELRTADQSGYLMMRDYVSPANKYGRYYFEDNELKAMVACSVFEDGVMLNSIYAAEGGMIYMDELYRAVTDAVRADFDDDAKVYIDAYGDRLKAYMTERIQARPLEVYTAYAAGIRIGGN